MAFRASFRANGKIPSFGFSGAGFLACYHLGVAKVLLEHGYLDFDTSKNANKPLLTGVRGGAIVITAVAAGVKPEDGMHTNLQLAQQTRQLGGVFDAFRPGYSLVDQLEEPFLTDITAAIQGCDEILLRRVNGGKLLRIGLSNRYQPPSHFRNPQAYCYVDQYRNVEDIIAACILSSYVPGVTGRWQPSDTILRASARLCELVELGFVKQQSTGRSLRIDSFLKKTALGDSTEERNGAAKAMKKIPWFVDGGLANGFPILDRKTVLVTPLAGIFDPNPHISPPFDDEDPHEQKGADLHNGFLHVSDRVKLRWHRQNLETLRRMILSSDKDSLERRYMQGYDNAERFLNDNNLSRIYHHAVS